MLGLGHAETATDWLLSFTLFSTAVRMCSESGACSDMARVDEQSMLATR